MIPLLAETSQLQLPSSYQGITVIALGGVVMAALTTGVVLAGFQRLRSALTVEMKREMETTAKAMAVQVQSPLVIQAHKDFVTTTAHKDSIDEIKRELSRQSARRAEIYETQKAQGQQLSALDEKTDMMNQQLIRQEGKIDTLLTRIPAK